MPAASKPCSSEPVPRLGPDRSCVSADQSAATCDAMNAAPGVRLRPFGLPSAWDPAPWYAIEKPAPPSSDRPLLPKIFSGASLGQQCTRLGSTFRLGLLDHGRDFGPRPPAHSANFDRPGDGVIGNPTPERRLRAAEHPGRLAVADQRINQFQCHKIAPYCYFSAPK